MAGGTGGHVFPALAVAQHLKQKHWEVSWIGTQRGMESNVIPAAGIDIDWLSVQGLRGKGLFSKVNNVLLLIKSFWQVFNIFRNRKPDVVLGMGGYVAGPGGLMAYLMNIPLVIHEQNRVPGTTNRLLLKKANKVLEAFPGSFAADENAIFTGNPLRADFLNFAKKNHWSENSKRLLRILIVGGSQGAQILNEVIPEVAKKIDGVEIKHQTGNALFKSVSNEYAKLSIKATAVEFIDDMASAYEWADMVICRSGAMTVSEVAAAGLPAIFIPLPHAIDDHQTANAKYLTDEGAGILLAQSELNEKTLIQAIKKIKNSIVEMGLAAKMKAKINATELVAILCAEEVKS